MALRKRTNKDGTITWVVRVKHQGREIVRSVSPSKREAQNVEAKLKSQIREPKFFDVPPGAKWTYDQSLDRYLEYGKVAKRPGTSTFDHQIAKHLLTVKEALGHQDLKTTQRYAHITPLHRWAAMEKLVDMAREGEGEEPEMGSAVTTFWPHNHRMTSNADDW
jgi:integrase